VLFLIVIYIYHDTIVKLVNYQRMVTHIQRLLAAHHAVNYKPSLLVTAYTELDFLVEFKLESVCLKQFISAYFNVSQLWENRGT
jgi:hypothetical protein